MHFQQTFQTSYSSAIDMEVATACVRRKIKANMNATFIKKYTKQDVEVASKQMAPLKSLGLDSFNPSFYQTYQHTVSDELTSIVLKFLNESTFDCRTNFTYIVFIPKIKNLFKPSDFKLISLCNVIYKLVLKVLANRLKQVLSTIISKNQSAFMLRQLINNNITVAQKAIHSMKTIQKEHTGSMAV